MDQISLALMPATRRTDPVTSHAAARAVAGRLSVLQAEVLEAFEQHDTLTDEALERLPGFNHLAPSTVRKRRSELYQAGLIREAGFATNSRGRMMIVWTVA